MIDWSLAVAEWLGMLDRCLDVAFRIPDCLYERCVASELSGY